MRTKTGNKLHLKGNMLPVSADAAAIGSLYASAVSIALRAEAKRPGGGAKMIMKWTGASERAVKGWLGGHRGPNGEHLIALIANSDAVTATVMQLAGRGPACAAAQIAEVRRLIGDATLVLDSLPR